MMTDFKLIAGRLVTEIRKDIFFFGTCGVVVGLLMLWQFKLKTLGVATGKAWPTELFSDFVSFNAFTLVFVGLIAIAAASTLFRSFGFPLPRLEALVAHLEERLSQIASSIISFTLGLSALALLHAVLTLEQGGLALALLVMIFDCVIFFGFVTAGAIARRVAPFDQRGPSLLALGGSVIFVGICLVNGIN
ncbi:hypothetical protein [Pseudoduganella sp. R-43]|uniref:hypothetical protein n=1 Tax=Pseudoduganella sp. R-43 TaxID=3404063 RepID=UPI003CE951D3